MEQSSQDLFNQTQASLGELQASLATVMGPAVAGSLDQQQLSDRLIALGAPPARAASAEVKQDYMDRLTAVMQETAQAQADQAIKAAQDKATAAVTMNVQKVKDAVNATATRCEQDLKQAQAINTTDGGVNSDPNRAIETFTNSIDTVTTIMKLIDGQETRLKAVSM